MTRIHINIPDSQTGKAEEIAILQKLVDNFAGTQSYLASLFTVDLFNWASEQIRCDFPPNIAAHWRADSKELTKANDDLKICVRELEDQIKTLSNELEDHQLAIEAQKAQVIELSKECEDHRSTIFDLREQRTKSIDKWQGAETGRHLLQRRLDHAYLKIQTLKARLFDYIEAEQDVKGDGEVEIDPANLMTDEELDKIRSTSDEPKYDYQYDDKPEFEGTADPKSDPMYRSI